MSIESERHNRYVAIEIDDVIVKNEHGGPLLFNSQDKVADYVAKLRLQNLIVSSNVNICEAAVDLPYETRQMMEIA